MIGASFRRVPRALVSLAAAVLLTVLVFPEVFFGGGSLSAVPFDRVLGQPRPPATVEAYPNIDSRPPTSGLVDLGARTWQYEPTMRYMARVLRDGSNPSWNPYQASGSLGPETLDGMQVSPFVLLVAGLGGFGHRLHDRIAGAWSSWPSTASSSCSCVRSRCTAWPPSGQGSSSC